MHPHLQLVLGRNLKLAREARGLTQMRLAELAGLSTSHLGEIETGRKFASAETLELLCGALDRPAWTLFLEPGAGVWDPASFSAELRRRLQAELSRLGDRVFSQLLADLDLQRQEAAEPDPDPQAET